MARILIVEDDLDLAEMLKEYLEETPNYTVVATLASEQEVYAWMIENELSGIDCALVDLSIPESNKYKRAVSLAGLGVIEQLRQDNRFNGKILVLTSSRIMEDGQRALQAGCDGYLCKHARTDGIASMVEELKLAIEGEVLVVSRQMRHVFIRDELSGKEARLMDMICDGSSWSEIARKLGYKSTNVATVSGFRVFDKLLAGKMQTNDSANDQRKKRELAVSQWRLRNRWRQGA